MNGIPPVLSLRPDTREAEAFIRMMLAHSQVPAMTYRAPARGWGDAYGCRRAAPVNHTYPVRRREGRTQAM